jgi:hypothetical protein
VRHDLLQRALDEVLGELLVASEEVRSPQQRVTARGDEVTDLVVARGHGAPSLC